MASATIDPVSRRPALSALLPQIVTTAGFAAIVFCVSLWQWQPIVHWLGRPAAHFVTVSFGPVAQAVSDRRRGRPAGLAVAALGAAGIVIGWYVMVPWVLDRVYEGRTVYAIEPVVYLALISLTVLATAMVVSAAAWLISRRQHPRELPAG